MFIIYPPLIVLLYRHFSRRNLQNNMSIFYLKQTNSFKISMRLFRSFIIETFNCKLISINECLIQCSAFINFCAIFDSFTEINPINSGWNLWFSLMAVDWHCLQFGCLLLLSCFYLEPDVTFDCWAVCDFISCETSCCQCELCFCF